MNLKDHHIYYTLRRFPEVAHSVKASEKLEATNVSNLRTRSRDGVRKQTLQRMQTTSSDKVYSLQRKLKDLKALSNDESDVLNQSWSPVRALRRDKSLSRTAAIANISSPKREEISPLESALRKLLDSGYPGVSENNRTYSLEARGLMRVLLLQPPFDEVLFSQQLVKILGISLSSQEAEQLLHYICNSSGSGD